jgi:DNA-binding CsgD family transcriptional regulator
MKNWQEEMLALMVPGASESEIFHAIHAAAVDLGFEHWAYGMRVPMSFSNPRTLMLNNYPVAWQERYKSMNYLQRDPTVQYALKSQAPILWSKELIAEAPDFWDEAHSNGLRVGWAQSSLDGRGAVGMLTLSRSATPLLASELQQNEIRMRWLAQLAHAILAPRLDPPNRLRPENALTPREIEVLKWTADGKTSGDIAYLLNISENTVNFHIKNAISKLKVANKTAAVVRAAVLGLLS